MSLWPSQGTSSTAAAGDAGWPAEDLHEAHAALDQPPGDQALPAERGAVLCCPGRRASASRSVSWLTSSASGAAICMR